MAKLYRVILPVSDIERAASFYTTLLGSSGTRVSSGRHYFNCEGTILACFDPMADGDGMTLPSNPDYIYLAVDDLELVFERVRKRPVRQPTVFCGSRNALPRVSSLSLLKVIARRFDPKVAPPS